VRYDQLKDSAGDAWQSAKINMEQALDKLERGYNRTLEAMKTDEAPARR